MKKILPIVLAFLTGAAAGMLFITVRAAGLS